jgi:hypothetical protein
LYLVVFRPSTSFVFYGSKISLPYPVQVSCLVLLTFDFVELRSVRSAPASVPFGVLLCAQKRAKRSFEPARAGTSNKRLARREPKPAHVVLAAATSRFLPLKKVQPTCLRSPHKARNQPRRCCTSTALLRRLLPAFLDIRLLVVGKPQFNLVGWGP